MCPSVPFPQTAAAASAPLTWLGYDITKHTVLKKKTNPHPGPRERSGCAQALGGERVETGDSKFSKEAGRGASGGQLGVATTMSQTWLGWCHCHSLFQGELILKQNITRQCLEEMKSTDNLNLPTSTEQWAAGTHCSYLRSGPRAQERVQGPGRGHW